jgi:transcriptional regulator with XRE-family HTH domain
MADILTPREVDYSAAMRAAYVLARLQDVLQTSAQRRRIAELTSIPAPTLKDYYSGRTSPPLDRFLLIAIAAGIDPAEFFRSPALMASKAATPSVVMIPVLDIDAAAGAGTQADVVKAVDELPFPTEFIRKLAPIGAELSCLRCSGDSMAPTIQDGAILIVDERQRALRPWRPPPRKGPRKRLPPDDIFVFNQSGGLRLKRLRDIGEGTVAILSDNGAENPPEFFKLGRDGGFAIIGKVIWWDNRL